MDLDRLKAIAARELTRHGLAGWSFHLARTKRRLGACKHRAKVVEVAEHHARHDPEAAVLDTLRHEVAHALAGPAAGHGPAWKRIAARLGATPRACAGSGVTLPPGDWRATCPACSKTYHRYRRPANLTGFRCRCPARSPLTFGYAGYPVRRPAEPKDAARWRAVCPGCGVTHGRVRRPRAGVWRCRCPGRCVIEWGPVRSPGATE